MRDAAIDPNRQPRRTGAARPASDRPKGDLSSAAIAAQRLGSALDRPIGRTGRPVRRPVRESRWRLPAFARRVRPIKALTTVVFSAALVGIVANAVLFQKGRHTGTPSDILQGTSASAPAPAAKLAAAPADAGPTGAVPAESSSVRDPDPAAVATDPLPVAAHRRPVAKRSGTKPEGGDAIGRLLGAAPAADDTTAAKATESKPADAKADAALLRAQRELKKLGYEVKPDGRMNGGTRQAIKRFAHDHHLKAEAALTPELRREIADASSASAKPAAEPAPKAR